MALTIAIHKKLPDNTLEEFINFKNVDFIHDFFTQRRFADNEDRETHALSLQVLRRELNKKIQDVHTIGEANLFNKLTDAYLQLDNALTNLNKHDKLVYHCTTKLHSKFE